MVHKINLGTLEDNINLIEKLTKTFKPIKHLEQTLQDKIKIAKEKLASLQPHRTKRGIINALGSVIKLIAGNPDNEDLEIIHSHLGNLRTQENKIIQNQNRQVQINELFKDKINNITDTIRKISTSISKEYNSVNGLRSDLEFINLIWCTDRIVHILENIEEQLEFSKVGVINKNILSLEEKQIIFDKLRNQNLQLKFIDEIFKYSSGSISISGKQAVLITKTPILEAESYDLLEIHTLNINETRIATKVHLVAKHGNQVYLQPTTCEICEGDIIVKDECIYRILSHQTPRCPLIKSKQKTRINEISQGIILVDTIEKTDITDSCGNSRMIREATIIETGNCSIQIGNVTYSGTMQPMPTEDYLIPIYTKTIEPLNYEQTAEDILHLKIQNLEILQNVQFSAHRKHITVIGGLFLLSITCLCLFFAISFKQKQKKAENGHPELHAISSIKDSEGHQISTKASLESIPMPDMEILEKSSEDVRQFRRGGVTPRTTPFPRIPI